MGDRLSNSTDVVRAGRKLKLKVRRLQKQRVVSLKKVPLPAMLERKDGRWVFSAGSTTTAACAWSMR